MFFFLFYVLHPCMSVGLIEFGHVCSLHSLNSTIYFILQLPCLSACLSIKILVINFQPLNLPCIWYTALAWLLEPGQVSCLPGDSKVFMFAVMKIL